MPKPVLFGLRGLQNEGNIVAASRHLTPICRGKWRSLGEDIGTTDLLAHSQDVVGTFLRCKLLALKEVVGANGFEPSTSWSRTSLDQTKSVELTAFACAFPPLIWATWATWATKYRFASVRDVHPRGSTSSEPASRAGLELQPFGDRTELARQFDYFAVQMTTVQDCSEPGLQRSMNLRPLLDPNEFRSNKMLVWEICV